MTTKAKKKASKPSGKGSPKRTSKKKQSPAADLTVGPSVHVRRVIHPGGGAA